MAVKTMTAVPVVRQPTGLDAGAKRVKLHGRAFYESIGSPRFIVAPMVDQSEFAWRLLSRSFLPESERSSILAYSPMLHARLFVESKKYREQQFQPVRGPLLPEADVQGPGPDLYLDGNPCMDRPLFVQFCANEPDALLAAAKMVAPYCDAVDLNLGCPQGIAKRGHYGAFLQEDQELVYRLIRQLHEHLSIPVTAKIRILDTKEATLSYARNVLGAGASILTVHGRRRDQKGHLTGLADWQMIRYLRENLGAETVLFANGNVLRHEDLAACLAATGADGVMSAEGNLSNPAMHAPPPPAHQPTREFWRGRDGRSGWRVDAVLRRYLDILHQHVCERPPPARRPLFVPGDDTAWMAEAEAKARAKSRRPQEAKRQKCRGRRTDAAAASPSLRAVQPHLFHMLRHLVSRHHDVRDMLARSRSGDMEAYETVLSLVEARVADGLLEYEATEGRSGAAAAPAVEELEAAPAGDEDDDHDVGSSAPTARQCRRPWWVLQPIVRPLPQEALAKGAIRPRKNQSVHALIATITGKNGSPPAPASTSLKRKVSGEKTSNLLGG